MSATGHSKFSASSAYRLLACPGSYGLGQACDTGERRATVFSAEGTLAHSVSEAAIFAGTDPGNIFGRTFHADGFEFTPDEDFIDGVLVYVDFVRNLQALGYIVVLETQVSPSIHWRKGKENDLGVDLFGTADCIAYHPDLHVLLIVDLKFGKGIAVEVKDNAQFLYYGAGSLSLPLINYMRQTHGFAPVSSLPDTLETIVVQPRAHHPDGPIRRAKYTRAEVIDWTRYTLHPGVERATKDNGKTLNAGEHCRFCPALAHCPEQRRLANEQAKTAFANAPLTNVPAAIPTDPTAVPTQAQIPAALPDAHISDEALGEMLDKVAVIKPYIAALEALAESRIKQTRNVKGWKVVPTRTRRVWNDDDANVITALHNMGVAPGLYTETRLLSPTQTEKRLGKAQFQKVLAQIQLVKQSTPGTTLVPDGDPRGRIAEGRSAKEAFGIEKGGP